MSITAHTPVQLRFFTPNRRFALELGGELMAPTVGYSTWGQLNAARDNVIWVCHALTGTSDVSAWWPGIFGAGRPLDPTRSFIVCANVLGGCYGSAGPLSLDPIRGSIYGGDFPDITIGDMAAHQQLLMEHLGVRGIQLLIGASMGGFQALELALREPERVKRLALVASSDRQPPQALAQAELQCEFIRHDPKFRDGHYPPEDPPERGLALARKLGHLTYRSPEELDRRFGRLLRDDGRPQVLSYLDHHGQKLVRRFDAVSYLRLTEAMNRFDRVQCVRDTPPQQPTLVVSIDSDQLYFPSEQQRVAAALPRGELLTLDSLYGHDGFLVESHRLVGPLMDLLGTAPVPCTRPVAAGGRMRLCG